MVETQVTFPSTLAVHVDLQRAFKGGKGDATSDDLPVHGDAVTHDRDGSRLLAEIDGCAVGHQHRVGWDGGIGSRYLCRGGERGCIFGLSGRSTCAYVAGADRPGKRGGARGRGGKKVNSTMNCNTRSIKKKKEGKPKKRWGRKSRSADG